MIAMIRLNTTNNLTMNSKTNRTPSQQQQHNPSSSYQYVATSGTSIKRIRTPHPNDVLCGRGGGINSHPGNKNFRNWVRERKEAYNLATSKVSKASVAREIVQIVRNTSPPGRFLMREVINGTTTSNYWTEIDDNKAMAKTSQALREGAPAIRSKAKLMSHHDIDDDEEHHYPHAEVQQQIQHEAIQPTRRSGRGKNRKSKRMKCTSTKNLLKNANEAITELRCSTMENDDNDVLITSSSQEEECLNEQEECSPSEVAHEGQTPSLIPISVEPPPNNAHFTTFLEEQNPNNSFTRKRPLPRAHSLAFSETNDEHFTLSSQESDDFHDPFAEETDDDINNDHYLSCAIEGNPELSAARSRLARQYTSLSSLKLSRNTSTGNNGDNRSLMSDLSDLPDACSPKFQQVYDWTEGMQEVRDAAFHSSAIFPSLQLNNHHHYPSNNHKNSRLVGNRNAFNGNGNVEGQ